MICLTQTRTGMPAGNCVETTIACLLDIEDVDQLPSLYRGPEAFEADPDRTEGFRELMLWLAERDRYWLELQLGATIDIDLWAVMLPLFKRAGDFLEALPWYEHHLLGGSNPGGLGHMVVGIQGQPIWDTNPSRAGIVSIEEVIFILSSTQLAELGLDVEERFEPGRGAGFDASPAVARCMEVMQDAAGLRLEGGS